MTSASDWGSCGSCDGEETRVFGGTGKSEQADASGLLGKEQVLIYFTKVFKIKHTSNTLSLQSMISCQVYVSWHPIIEF